MAQSFPLWQKPSPAVGSSGLLKGGDDFPRLKFIKLNHEELSFEKRSFRYVLFTPTLFLIAFYVYLKKKIIRKPKYNFYFFDGISKNCREIKENAARWRALDIVYNYHKGDENIFADFWHDLRSSQATRNRLKLIKFLLLKNIEKIWQKGDEPRLISIASGSAQGVIEAIVAAKEKKGILVRCIFIDLDLTALEHAQKLAKKAGVESQIIFVNKTASIIGEVGKEFKPNLIEMVGFLEYRPDEKAIRLVNSIYQVLEKEGVFLVSQIAPNSESFFLREVINWPMIYRNPERLAKILSLGGFSLNQCVFYQEPLKIHYVVECKKI
jgi:SAM-dependent methyltransferase